ncbi:MAG: hypothetical protein KAI47_06710, partial [Deltaproteobacteria bacterium]|nr:hypothetical protein [Deltaproteobacteria bacterium]
IHAETRSPWSQADTLTYAGLLTNARGNPAGAINLLREAHKIALRVDAKYIVINALNGIALVYADRGDAGDAQEAIDAATEAFERAGILGAIVGEIPGLARAARGHAQLGAIDTARGLSRRAVELLTTQRQIDGPEEEIYYTHFRILQAGDAPDAIEHLRHAKNGLDTKLEGIRNTDQRRAFCEFVRLNAAILADAERLGI